MTHLPLAAIQFETGDIDGLLGTIARDLTARGLEVRGVLQFRSDATAECHCADMDLQTISSGRVFRISQPLGNGSRGCRLDPGALAECSAFLTRDMQRGCDLLILNRFGRGESEGRGFRDLMTSALVQGIPVLTATRPEYAASWRVFSGDLGCDLPMNRASVFSWVTDQVDLKTAA